MLKSVFVVIVVCGLLAGMSRGWNAVLGAGTAQAEATYMGAASCKMCHTSVHTTWTEGSHSRAWDVLTEKYHDPEQVDEAGKACVACHATGFGQGELGGFVDLATTPDMVGVQCEACHGPGSLHADASLELMRSRRKEFGDGEDPLITLTPTNCASCHNPHVSYAKYKGG